jgi:hypothetical protein
MFNIKCAVADTLTQLYMHTCSSPPQSECGDIPTSVTAVGLRCDWSLIEEVALINFLIDHKAKAGDSATFKPVIWRAAGLHLESMCTKGAPKTDSKCMSKWTRVRSDLL